MKAQALLKYIGRDNAEGYAIKSKKFAEGQRQQLGLAFKDGLTVRIFGVPRCDLRYLASLLSCEIEDDTVTRHCKKKAFNKNRQLTCFVRTSSGQRELWVLVFPSANYVDQIAEVIQAIFDDFERCRLNRTRMPEVLIHHFPDLEANLTRWTDFEIAISHAVRYGDVVAIGNVDLFESGIKEFGFRPTSSTWEHVGFERMFAIKTLVEPQTSKRIVLIGVTECFWGQASGFYTAALLNRGSRHILYGSKAATLIDDGRIAEVFSPGTFYSFDPNRDDGEGLISKEGEHDSQALSSVFSPFGIQASGAAITVPTVMGEDAEQRTKYEAFGPTCMDCENGYIARAIRDHNLTLRENLGASFDGDAHFLPIHFITDYIHKDRERPAGKRHLAVHDDPEYLEDRRESFLKIGRCFAVYALKHGLRDELAAPKKIALRRNTKVEIEGSLAAIRPFLEAGAAHRAILNLLAQHEGRAMPIADVIAICSASQKCGYTQFFDAVYSRLTDNSVFARLSPEDKLRIEMLRIKMLSQVGDYSGLAQQLDRVDRMVGGSSLLDVIDQVGAFQRRAAMLHACNGQLELCAKALTSAGEKAERAGDKYHALTTQLFQLVAGLFDDEAMQERSLEDVSNLLSTIRRSFGSVPNVKWTQTHAEKCSIAALYLEGAYYLKFGALHERERGLRALYLAQLQNQRFGGNETSEGYGEILWASNSTWIKSALSLSMRRNIELSRGFESFIRKSAKWTSRLSHHGMALMNLPIQEREQAVLTLLSDSEVRSDEAHLREGVANSGDESRPELILGT